EVFYTLGSLSVRYSRLAQLQPGDLVVLPEMPSDLVLVRAYTGCYAIRRVEQKWVCISREDAARYRAAPGVIEGMGAMSQESSDPERAALPGELGVIIDFALGRTTVPLARVQAWQPGMIVSLEPPAVNDGVEVTIRANGQVIGTGDLVRIDDRVAVRLT